MRFDSTSFGEVVIDGTRYRDVYVFVDGTVSNREIENHHLIAKEEIEKLLLGNPEVIVIGNGQSSCVTISEDAKTLCNEKGVELISEPTPKAIFTFNRLKDEGKWVAAIIHVTC